MLMTKMTLTVTASLTGLTMTMTTTASQITLTMTMTMTASQMTGTGTGLGTLTGTVSRTALTMTMTGTASQMTMTMTTSRGAVTGRTWIPTRVRMQRHSVVCVLARWRWLVVVGYKLQVLRIRSRAFAFLSLCSSVRKLVVVGVG
jgi:hypothetical protein